MGESSILGSDFISMNFEKVHIIKNKFKTSYSRKKSYIDQKKSELEFKEGDKGYLKILTMKRVVRFGMKGSSKGLKRLIMS